MCGFAGIVRAAPRGDEAARAERAVALLAHRGPDGAGRVFLAPDGTGELQRGRILRPLAPAGTPPGVAVAVAHRRLAIIDRSDDGLQPVAAGPDALVVAWNGEAYNYREVRDELAALGVRCTTASDTEVLAAGWACWGPAVLARLTGMYAIAMIDRAQGGLWLARDPFGIKPLYVARRAGEVAFASELPALLALTGERPRVAPSALATYLASGVTDRAPATLFDGIEAVPPGVLWRIALAPGLGCREADAPAPPPTPLAPRGAPRVEQLRALVDAQVRLHLRSDVPVGVCVSGGVDSSAVAASARVALGAGAPLLAFSYRPVAEAVDEGPWIDAIVAATGATPHVIRPGVAEFAAEAEALVGRQGEPIGTPAIVVQALLFRAAAEAGVRVVLDGQGGDELFGGYDFARAARLAGHLRRGELARARRFAAALAARGEQRPLARAAALLGAGAVRAVRTWRGASPYGPLAQAAWMRERGVAPLPAWRPRTPRVLQERLADALHATSIPALLRYADRSAMAVSVENRVPLLVPAIASFAAQLDDDELVADDGTTKALFRASLRGRVPDAILDRRDKVGFSVPWRAWLAGAPAWPRWLAEAGTLPGVNARAAARLALAVRAGRALSPAELGAAWRLAGLAAWAGAYGVAFD